jgi:hypothetical protein
VVFGVKDCGISIQTPHCFDPGTVVFLERQRGEGGCVKKRDFADAEVPFFYQMIR